MFLLFFLCWIIFAGDITPEFVIFGLAVAAVIFAFQCRFLDYSIRKEIKLYRNLIWGIIYVFVLVLEILKANIGVIHFILSAEDRVEPQLVHFKTDLKSDMARVILANSITLTPGTITVSLEEDEYTVHCLDKSMAEGMNESIFVQMLRRFEEKEEQS
ncbi:MAG: Na+/H+ antiporter subunit E [Lachnospiraceae bacterium]|nr:Na+/H+ antiporter subunit E [Lachnospiraceae bacterium]